MSSTSKFQNLKRDRDNPAIFTIIVAAGQGSRFGNETPKQFCDMGGFVPLRKVVGLFLSFDFIKGVLCVIPEGYRKRYNELLTDISDDRLLPFVYGGDTRQESVENGLKDLQKYTPEYVLIHDACRCYCSKEIIYNVCNGLFSGAEAVVPAIKSVDAVRYDGKSIDKNQVEFVQTPQGFRYDKISKLHEKYANKEFADDASMCDCEDIEVVTVSGSIKNKKITYKSDIESKVYRTGYGYDAHKFSADKNRALYIMGEKIDGFPGLDGVSDADVGVHSLVDAILGALCLGSIGEQFPEDNPKNRNIRSLIFLEHCRKLLLRNNANIMNIDTTIICELPKISRYAGNMRRNIARCLGITPSIVNIKGKTTEGMGFEGRREGISATSILTLMMKI